MFKKRYFFILFIFSSFFLIQDADALVISPARFNVTIEPGASQNLIIKIKNDEAQKVDLNLKVLGAKQDEYGRPLFFSGIEKAEEWVKPKTNKITVGASQEKNAEFLIEIPKQIIPGSHYLGLAVEQIQTENSNQVGLSGRLVALLTLRITGNITEDANFVKWTGRNFTWNKEWPFVLELKNQGNIEVALTGETAIKNWRGKEIFRQPVFLGNSLLAGAIRFNSGKVKIGDKIKWPGLYQTEMRITYGQSEKRISKVFYIWYFPKWSAAAFFAMMFIILWRMIRKIRRKRKFGN
jgi:hypothetical protein